MIQPEPLNAINSQSVIFMKLTVELTPISLLTEYNFCYICFHIKLDCIITGPESAFKIFLLILLDFNIKYCSNIYALFELWLNFYTFQNELE